MQRISSRMTFYYKRIFPVMMFGFLLLFVTLPFVVAKGADALPPVPFLLIPVVIAVGFYFMMKKLIFDLVDEAWDAGDALIIRDKGREDRIALTDIMNVSYSTLLNPPRVTLLLRNPGIFGNEVTFSPPVRFVPFAKSPIVDDLIARVDAARRSAR